MRHLARHFPRPTRYTGRPCGSPSEDACLWLPFMCARYALIGAKPVPEASRTIGLSESSRRKKLPNGPSTRRISFSFIALNTWSVNLPPGRCLMCRSIWGFSPTVCGAFAIE